MTPYYEIHGEGVPLLLLPDSFGTARSWGEVLPALAAHHQVVAVELQGHGHTPDVDRPLRYDTLADDVAALIDILGPHPVDVLGYDLGGAVALRLALRLPSKVRNLILVSTAYAQEGWAPTPSPELREAYEAVAPRLEDWEILVGKVSALLGQDYDWSDEVGTLEPRTLLVYGDRDAIPLTHATAFFTLLGNGHRPHQLAVLPNTTHESVSTSPSLADVTTRFLTDPHATR